jgi:hypothetical protein
VALGIAVTSALVFGVSLALGAFLAGMIVSRSQLSARAASEALPMRDAFAVLFFVSVGMLVDPSQLAANAKLIATTVAVVLLGKALVAFAVVRLLGHPVRTAVVIVSACAWSHWWKNTPTKPMTASAPQCARGGTSGARRIERTLRLVQFLVGWLGAGGKNQKRGEKPRRKTTHED